MAAIIFAVVGMFSSVALVGAFLYLNSILVLNSPIYMAVNPCIVANDARYIQKLPNVLIELYDAGFTSPWPARPTAWSAMMFRRRLLKMFNGSMAGAPRWTQRHLSVWAFVQLHHEELQQFLRHRQMLQARRVLAKSPEADVRTQMLGVLNWGSDLESRTAAEVLTPAAAARETWTHDWIAQLQKFDVLLREHGYSVSEEFSIIERLRTADEAIVHQELFAHTH